MTERVKPIVTTNGDNCFNSWNHEMNDLWINSKEKLQKQRKRY